jgi:hypothetical protein
MADQFDAFISYARRPSSDLANALQGGIERFAKPWNRLRAARVFRDDSSMSANTALWSTIVGGLNQARWLILLASPEAAMSEYVELEVNWWLKNKSSDNILLVQADGELYWDRKNARFSDSTDIIPPSLRAAYKEEPRWIDMRWYGQPGRSGTA